ncbi:O-fucosyltransferase family protein [Klebsormidium nitens]|uniref:O-fucosyltransferase family protein n=1 Tax=Klebsormidium nitens TaxID=105231 RepID=A0A1Y1HVF8_KLENI|nr:O-fucosyltransferase family protein [Klebsormidium nitens]|eukprot:GAQ82620.1 O-fucosyltransferase family protein [Klebsormidium nitens]
MGFRQGGSEGTMGRSRSYSTLPETLVKLEPPPFNPARTAKRSSWAAAPPCKQKVDALPVTQGVYEKGHDGGLVLASKKGGWMKEVRRAGNALVALALTALFVTAVLSSSSRVNQDFSPDRSQSTALSEPRVRALLGGANLTARPATIVKVSKHKSKSKSHAHSGHSDGHSVGQLSESHAQLSQGHGHLSVRIEHLSKGDGDLSNGLGQLSEALGQPSAQNEQLSDTGLGQSSPGLAQLARESNEMLQGEKRELHAGAENTGEDTEVREKESGEIGLGRNEVTDAGVPKNEVGGRVAAAGWWRGFSRLDDVRAELSARSVSEEDAEMGARTTAERVVEEQSFDVAEPERNRVGVGKVQETEGLQTVDEAGREGGESRVEAAGARERKSRGSEGLVVTGMTGAPTETDMETATETDWEERPRATAPKRANNNSEEETEAETETEKGVVLTEEGRGQQKGGSRQLDLWKAPDRKGFRPCLEKMATEEPPYVPTGYLMVQCNGGLNQQRAAVCNAVALARYLNLTLLVPYLQAHAVWNDHTKFQDLFDLEHFIQSLEGHVRVERGAPSTAFGGNLETLRNIPRNARLDWYDANVHHVLPANGSGVPAKPTGSGLVPRNASARVVWMKPFAKRLDNNLPHWMQQLRCKANYEALRFAPEIERLGSQMSARMRAATGGRPWIAVHLRFEIDMVAYSMCNFGGGKEEQKVLHAYRMTHWDVTLRRSREKRSPESQRQRGQCPLTPEEAALFLRALGFDENTHIYLATHDQQLYGGPESLAPFKALFPRTSAKADLLDAADLAALQKKASSLAALDYVMGRAADVFIPTATGNMPNLIMGHRMYDGFKKTIEPHHRKLAALLAQRNALPWETIAEQIRTDHEFRDGGPSKRARTSNFYGNPSECFCHEASGSDVSLASAPDVSLASAPDVSSEYASEVGVNGVLSHGTGHGFDM